MLIIFPPHNQDTPEQQSEEEENPQKTPPPPSPIIQVWFCLLSKYLNLFMILNLILFPFAFIRCSIRLQLPGSPLIQVRFQNSLMNMFCIFLIIILQLADHALSELLGQPNTAIPSTSSQPLVPAGSNLEEIRLKQVNNYTFCWPIPLLFCFYRPS